MDAVAAGSAPHASRTQGALRRRSNAAARAYATTAALLLFVIVVTLDDVRVLRWPVAYAGVLLAALVFGLAPAFLADRIAAHARAALPADPVRAAESQMLRARLVMGATILLFVAWLVLLSSGRTPRW